MDDSFVEIKPAISASESDGLITPDRGIQSIKYGKSIQVFWDVKSKVRQLVWDTVNGILQIFAISRTELSHILIDVAEELLKKEG